MNFNQKYEPKGKKILHGAGQDIDSFNQYSEAVETYSPLIYMTYVRINEIKKWSDRIVNEMEKFSNLYLQIGLHLRKKIGNSYISQCKEICSGKYDADLKLFSDTLKKLSIPAFIRIGYEFNEPNKYVSEDYVLTWRYIVRKLKEFGYYDFATVWCICPAFSKNIFQILPHYPGDKYVDWFGIDLFTVSQFKDNKNKITERFLLEAKNHKKPVMIGECSPIRLGIGKKSWDLWFKPFFKWMYSHQIVKAYCYINWNWKTKKKKWKDWGDCRIQKNEFIRQKYVNELKKDVFIHNTCLVKPKKPEKIIYSNQEKIYSKVIKEIKKDLPKNSEVYLFGSLAERKFGKYVKKYGSHEGSDIDIIVFILKRDIPKHWKYLNVSKTWWSLYRGIKIKIDKITHRTDILLVKEGCEELAKKRMKEKKWKIEKLK